ncbi:hypothetical protein GYMLUDRAFT_675397 [Collybiopsis luxurians FD-317 M1]|uniref:Unplaced genomic scaffold GYMLUscaffold_32, whole genome shotgun sequence n=1 Tax=Collybiopsis luxurians FD-317 M1 TaxID=944289 RepID=A0A0D0B725_9AGAR|nr:hypothetical protein GYMLUDRAFT_675397 [Collybiopsis luxurians FD-317 M1]
MQTTILTEKCRSNSIPTTSVELAQLRALIQDTRNALKTCTDEKTHAQLEQILRFQESLLSPIRTLPPEILYEIFKFLVTSINFTPFKLQGSVFTLTWVCFWWRNCALSHTTLWSSYTVGAAYLWDRNLSVDWLLKECLSRSGNYSPLNITIMTSGEPFDTEIWTPLLDHTKRWRNLRLVPLNLSALLYLRNELEVRQEDHDGLTTTYFPYLEKLTLIIPNVLDMDELPIIPLHDLFSTCPSLHTLRMSHLRVSDILDFSHLTALRIDECYQGRFFATLLAKCPLLQTFTVGRFISGNDPTPTTSYILRISHTNLTTLNLTWYDKNCAIGFWQYVSLPKLACLLVSVKGYQAFEANSRPDPLRELKKMILESKCSLVKIHLGRSLPYDAIVSFFEGLDIIWGEGNVVVNSVVYNRDAILV